MGMGVIGLSPLLNKQLQSRRQSFAKNPLFIRFIQFFDFSDHD